MHVYNCVMFQAARYAQSLENAVWTNQFDNTANRRAHIETTGPEIWQETSLFTIIHQSFIKIISNIWELIFQVFTRNILLMENPRFIDPLICGFVAVFHP